MADLLLHEQRVEPVLDQMRHVGAAQRVQVQRLIEADLAPVAGEDPVQVRQRDPARTLGRETLVMCIIGDGTRSVRRPSSRLLTPCEQQS